MIRALITLVLLAGVAHADVASDSKTTFDTAMARWNAAADDRGVFAKLWDLIESTPWDDLKQTKADVVADYKGIEKRLKAQEVVDAEIELGRMKLSIVRMDRAIETYKASTKATVWKMQLGIGLFIVGVFGMSIWRFLRRRVRS